MRAIKAPQRGAELGIVSEELAITGREEGKKRKMRMMARSRSGISCKTASLTPLEPLPSPVPTSQWGMASRR